MFSVINITDIEKLDLNDITDVALRKYKNQKENKLQIELKNCIKDGTINVNMLSDGWFPLIKEAKVFLSHSSKDKELVYRLSYYLEKECSIKTFVDSMVWGYSDQLLKEIDDKYCYDKKDRTYSYKLRNITTSNIHLMLNNALIRMLDHCELVLFINTENSILSSDKTDNKLHTRSPWIFTELEGCRMLRIVVPKYLKPDFLPTNESVKMFSKSTKEIPDFNYDIDLNQFPKASIEAFIDILKSNKGQSDEGILYELYKKFDREKLNSVDYKNFF